MRRYPLIITLASAVACSPVDGGFGETGATLRGRIVRADGTAAGAMKVHVRGADGRSAIAAADQDGRFALTNPPLGRVRLLGHDGRGRGLRLDASLIDGGENDLGDVVLRPLAELPAMVTESGLGLEERVTELDGNCLYPVFSSDHLRAYCMKTRGDDIRGQLVEIEIATGAVRIIDDTLFRAEQTCDEPPLRLIDDAVLVLVGEAVTYAFGLGPQGRVERRPHGRMRCVSTDDISVDGPFLTWMDYEDYEHEPSLATVVIDGDPFHMARPADIVVPGGPGLVVHRSNVLATSPTRLAVRLSAWVETSTPTPSEVHAVHVFDLVNRTVSVVNPSEGLYTLRSGAFVGDQLRLFTSDGIVGFDAQGAEQLVIQLPHWRERFFVRQPGATTGVLAVDTDERPGVQYRVDLAAGTATEYDYAEVQASQFPYAAVRGTRAHANGDLAVVHLVQTSTWTQAYLVETTYHPDSTVERYTFETRDDESSGPISRVTLPDGSRTALLLADASGFRQVHEGLFESAPAQRTFIAGSHIALDYAADGSALHFFGLDPLSGYIQLFRLSTAEAAPAP